MAHQLVQTAAKISATLSPPPPLTLCSQWTPVRYRHHLRSNIGRHRPGAITTPLMTGQTGHHGALWPDDLDLLGHDIGIQ